MKWIWQLCCQEEFSKFNSGQLCTVSPVCWRRLQLKTIPSWMLLFIYTGQLIMCPGKVYESFACQRLWNPQSTPTSTLLWHQHGLAHVTGNWGQRAAQHKKVFGVAWQFHVLVVELGARQLTVMLYQPAYVCVHIFPFILMFRNAVIVPWSILHILIVGGPLESFMKCPIFFFEMFWASGCHHQLICVWVQLPLKLYWCW